MLSGRDFIHRERKTGQEKCHEIQRREVKVRGTLLFTSAAWKSTEEKLLWKGPGWAMREK